MKSTAKGACILPHGVLFRGNTEAEIRRALVRRGYINGIIGLPANLFYGTGIPACIIVLDKQDAQARKGIFMIDASLGFMKDGPKNRMRAQDIHRIVDVFTRQMYVPTHARMVAVGEIERNDFNLNLPRYIDRQTAEDMQDIDGHLRGGIPASDIDALQRYSDVCPGLRATLFRSNRPGCRAYDIYQHLMDYWAETMQDDLYPLAADGWKAETYRIVETDKTGKQRDKGWACDLVDRI